MTMAVFYEGGPYRLQTNAQNITAAVPNPFSWNQARGSPAAAFEPPHSPLGATHKRPMSPSLPPVAGLATHCARGARRSIICSSSTRPSAPASPTPTAGADLFDPVEAPVRSRTVRSAGPIGEAAEAETLHAALVQFFASKHPEVIGTGDGARRPSETRAAVG
jgi:hypothetical protein